MSEQDSKNKVKGSLKSEIAKRNLNYVEIAVGLEKIGRGTFGAIFMMQILEVIECHELNIDDRFLKRILKKFRFTKQ